MPGISGGRDINELRVGGGEEKTWRPWRRGSGFSQKEENCKIGSMTTKAVRYIFCNLLGSNLYALLVGTLWEGSHNRSGVAEAGPSRF